MDPTRFDPTNENHRERIIVHIMESSEEAFSTAGKQYDGLTREEATAVLEALIECGVTILLLDGFDVAQKGDA